MTSEGAPVAQNSGTTNNTDVPSTSTYQQQVTCCTNHVNLQNLKQKKIELEKKLSEKCKLLSQIIRDENNLLKLATSNSTPVTPNTNTIQSSMRRKIIGTSFKLPENFMNSPPSSSSPNNLVSMRQKEEFNQLLLDKKNQQQISESALKLANDVSQTKSIRKTHRQHHDLAQEKLKMIEKNILLMQLQHSSGDSSGKHIVRHNSIKITMPMSINQTRYQQPNEKLSPYSNYPYPNTNTIPSISMNHKQVYNTSKDAKIKKSTFLDSEYTYTGNQVPGGTPPYNEVQYLTGDIISPNYGNINQIDDDFAQYTTAPTAYHNPKLKQPQYQNGGLGGYWYTSENNDRIWCSDNRFSSLDRKTNQTVTTVPRKTHSPQQPTKSTSLGNFEFISAPNLSKHDEASDSISISSINSENKKPKDKIWCETSLDSPTVSLAYKNTSSHISNNNNNNSRLCGTGSYKATSPQLYHQHHYNHQPNTSSSQTNSHHRTNESTKPKLSSHSMSLPNRNFVAGLPNPNHTMPYDDLYLTMPPYPDYYQTMQPSPDGSTIKSPTSRVQNNRIMTPSPIQSQQQASTIMTSTTTIDQDTIRFESPKNITVIQQAKFRPYKEISKPFEMADFYKYSTKFRQKNAGINDSSDPSRGNIKLENKNRNDLDDLNLQAIQKIYYQPPNPSLCQPINYQ